MWEGEGHPAVRTNQGVKAGGMRNWGTSGTSLPGKAEAPGQSPFPGPPWGAALGLLTLLGRSRLCLDLAPAPADMPCCPHRHPSLPVKSMASTREAGSTFRLDGGMATLGV